MLAKILAIAWNGIYRTFTDRMAIVFMFVLPIALSTIIGLAFGSGNGDISIETSQFIVINLDQGVTRQDQTINHGAIYTEILVTNPPDEVAELIDGKLGTDVDKARAEVEAGDVRGLLVIPADFSEKLEAGEAKQVELYYNPGSEIGASVLISIVDYITASLNAGQVAQQLLVNTNDGYFVQRALETNQIAKVGEAADAALTPIYNGVGSSSIRLNTVSVEGEVQEFDSLRYFAPSMAIFFMTFAMAAGTRGILEEQRDWTLQRIMTTPTPRWVYMLGRLLGTYASGLIQMLLLLLITPLIALMLGREGGVWGNNYLALALMTLAVVAAGTGLGLLIAALSKTVTQADNFSSAFLVVMAIVGGTFVPIDGVAILDAIKQLSLNYWGLQGFNELANNQATLSEIILNVAVLFVMAGAFFSIALWRFNKRLDV